MARAAHASRQSEDGAAGGRARRLPEAVKDRHGRQTLHRPGGALPRHHGHHRGKFMFGFRVPFLYTVGILCNEECCVRQVWCSSIIL